MMMHSSSFESLKPSLFGYYLKNIIIVLLRHVILAQSTPILLHTEGLVSFVSLSTVQFVSSVPGRFAFYGVIGGYFDLIKVPLKVILCPWASGSKQILNGLSNEWFDSHA